MIKPVEECKTVYELFQSPHRWTRGAFARDERGGDVEVDSKRAVCWCVIGAIRKIYGDWNKEALEKLYVTLGDNGSILELNDKEGYYTVLEKVKEAGI